MSRLTARLASGVALVGLLAFVALTAAILVQRGPFRFVGIDFVSYYSAARMVAEGRPRSMYDPLAMQALEDELLAPWGWEPDSAVYPFFLNPPAMALLVLPLTALPLATALLVWELIGIGASLATAVLLGRRAWGTVSASRTLVLLAFYPALFGLFYGQIAAVMVLCLALSYLALKDGQDLKAGLIASSLLLLKPQYAPPLILALAMHRRWRAIGGIAVGGLALAALSLAVIGPAGVSDYLRFMRSVGSYGPDAVADTTPYTMVSWRGLLNALAPGLSAPTGFVITALLSLVAVAAALFAFRGQWAPNSYRFDRGMLLLFIAALFAAFHSNVHGLSILLVPGVFLVASREGGLAQRWAPIGFALPSLVFLAFGTDLVTQGVVLAVGLIATFALLLWEALRDPEHLNPGSEPFAEERVTAAPGGSPPPR